MSNPCTFPFGQPVKTLKQLDCTQKDFFVLGVYASAVHARWIGKNGETRVHALAIASEPCIFWRGDDAEKIISQIAIPSGIGYLKPAQAKLNGPSGQALDKYFLEPLGISRADTWLCDLVPHSCMNSNQKKALRENMNR